MNTTRPSDSDPTSELLEAIASGDPEAVRALLERGADPNAIAGRGLRPLHVAGAGGHPALWAALTEPFTVELSEILRDDATLQTFGKITAMLLERGALPNERFPDTGITALMLARYFGQSEAARVLLENGAIPSLLDAWGRTADRHRIFQSIARLIRTSQRSPSIRSAYFGDMHMPATEQFTSPLVGLELSGSLPPDTFAGWPADEPLMIFALAQDPMSKLLQLSAPVYKASTFSTSYELADAVAKSLGGKVHTLIGDSESTPVAVSTKDGRMALLIRRFGGSFSVSLQGGQYFRPALGNESETAVPEIAARTQAWALERPNATPIVEAALYLTHVLTRAFGERWEVSIPGTSDPSEIWLHGPDGQAASVGVFGDRVVVWIDDEPRTTYFQGRNSLRDGRALIVARVREQKQRYAKNLETSERVRALASELTEKIASRLPPPRTWECVFLGSTSHSSAGSASIRYEEGGKQRTLGKISVEEGKILLQAGLLGELGFEDELTSVDAVIDLVVSALKTSFVTLTVEDLEPGQRYRVIETLQSLKQGTVVEYVGFNDLDNHYGEYDFRSEDGKPVSVGGDCSSREGNPLRQVHRHLEKLG